MNDAALASARLAELPGGDEAGERIAHIERALASRPSWGEAGPAPGPGEHLDADVLFAGGGLYLTLAPYLARRGLKVVVVERRRSGDGHREWNISGPELAPLVTSGLLTGDEVEGLVARRYRHGVCRWHGGGVYPVRDVLDHAIDAGAYLEKMRSLALEAGVKLIDFHTATGLSSGPHGVRLRAQGPRGERLELSARVLVDAQGAASPDASADLSCPTVGGVIAGLAEGSAADEVDHEVGDILVTTEHRDDGRQHIWEGFPAGGRALTTYLFYYERREALPPSPLLSLYGRFFRTLGRYKRGQPEIKRLTFGLIPGHSRLGPLPTPSRDRVLLVGDAAARHSPLTFCGFGNMVRSFAPLGDGLIEALDRGRLSRADLSHLVPDRPLLSGVGALALLLARPKRGGDAAATNRLLDAAFSSLYRKGDAVYGSLLRDEMSPSAFAAFLHETSLTRREVYTDVLRYLSPRELGSWSAKVALGFARDRLSAAQAR